MSKVPKELQVGYWIGHEIILWKDLPIIQKNLRKPHCFNSMKRKRHTSPIKYSLVRSIIISSSSGDIIDNLYIDSPYS